MNIEKIKEIFADEAFVKGLLEMESVAEAQAALKEKGIEMTEEQILVICENIMKVESGEISAEQLESGELSEEMLGQVAGGSSLILTGVVGAAKEIGRFT